jgi:hypothetical protein
VKQEPQPARAENPRPSGRGEVNYLHFKQQGHYDGGRVEIEMCAPAGHRLYWVIAVEPPQDDDAFEALTGEKRPDGQP